MGTTQLNVALDLRKLAGSTAFGAPKPGDDLTFYIPADGDRNQKLFKNGKKSGDPVRYSGTAIVTADSGTSTGRLLACECWFGSKMGEPRRWISCTLRVKNTNDTKKRGRGPKAKPTSNRPTQLALQDRDTPSIDSLAAWSGDPTRPSLGFACSFRALAQLLIDTVISDSNSSGLVVLAGATSSGKSKLAQAMIAEWLSRLPPIEGGRLPHVVTLEDPIEDFLFSDPNQAAASHINYTARLRGRGGGEHPTLKDAVDDALRQTPKVFYVSEIREDRDWRELLRMAGTGHLVMTTTHAKSVTECMRRILTAMGVDSARRRGEVAQRLKAVIQLSAVAIPIPVPDSKSVVKTTVSAVWRSTPRSVSALVADGLGSLLPARGEASDSEMGSLGRSHLAEALRTRLKGQLTSEALHKVERIDTSPQAEQALSTGFWDSLILRSLELDEAGL